MIEIVEKYCQGKMSQNEIASLREHLESDDEARREFFELYSEWQLFASVSKNHSQGMKQLKSKKIKHTNIRTKSKKRNKRTSIPLMVMALASICVITFFLLRPHELAYIEEAGIRRAIEFGTSIEEIRNATIVFEDGTKINVEVANNLSVGLSPEGGKVISLKTGRLNAIVKAQTHPMLLKTVHCKVEVLGTDLSIDCDEKLSSVKLNKGKISVTNQEGKSAILKPGDELNTDGQTLELLPLILRTWDKTFTFDATGKKSLEAKVLKKLTKGTILFDFRTEAFQQGHTLLFGWHDQPSSRGYQVYLHEGRICAQFKTLALEENNLIGPEFKPGKSYNVAFTFDNGGQAKLYVNGELSAIAENFSISATNDELHLGGSPDLFWKFFNGSLSNLKIFSSVLDEEQIVKIKNEKE